VRSWNLVSFFIADSARSVICPPVKAIRSSGVISVQL